MPYRFAFILFACTALAEVSGLSAATEYSSISARWLVPVVARWTSMIACRRSVNLWFRAMRNSRYAFTWERSLVLAIQNARVDHTGRLCLHRWIQPPSRGMAVKRLISDR
jgi:hypothetical protein